MNLVEAKKSLDKVIKKGRVHLYKPIQIAEILYRDRVYNDITLSNLDTYRTKSRQWRDIICLKFLGRTSTSSARYQDDLFNNNAVSPEALVVLGDENRKKAGVIEAYIYRKFIERYLQMTSGLQYCYEAGVENFELSTFFDLFWTTPGLRRSIDKVFEIVVYSLFQVLVEELDVSVRVSLNLEKIDVLKEFEDFTTKVLTIDSKNTSFTVPAKFHRVGVTNAADRGLDMWGNCGFAVQIKHLSLDERLAENIVSEITADRIIIVCKDSEEKIIVSILNQIGWKSKIQSIITMTNLEIWYEKALRGTFSQLIAKRLLAILTEEIKCEFPASNNTDFNDFITERMYNNIKDPFWE
jgi:type II restriction enzyme